MRISDDMPKALGHDDGGPTTPPAQATGATIISLLDRLPASSIARQRQASGEMIDEVAERIGIMAGRTRELETYIQSFEEWSAAQVTMVETVADHWKTVTSAAELKIEQLQRSLELSKRRAELAECDLQNVRYRLEALHDRIAKVFGAAAKFRSTREAIGFE